MESESKKLSFYTFGVNLVGLMLGTAVYFLSDLIMAAGGFILGIIGSSFLVYRKEESKRKKSKSTAELFRQAMANRQGK